jgi:hypothetical protein
MINNSRGVHELYIVEWGMIQTIVERKRRKTRTS